MEHLNGGSLGQSSALDKHYTVLETPARDKHPRFINLKKSFITLAPRSYLKAKHLNGALGQKNLTATDTLAYWANRKLQIKENVLNAANVQFSRAKYITFTA